MAASADVVVTALCFDRITNKSIIHVILGLMIRNGDLSYAMIHCVQHPKTQIDYISLRRFLLFLHYFSSPMATNPFVKVMQNRSAHSWSKYFLIYIIDKSSFSLPMAKHT